MKVLRNNNDVLNVIGTIGELEEIMHKYNLKECIIRKICYDDVIEVICKK